MADHPKVKDIAPRIQYTLLGNTPEFEFPFLIFDESHLVVLLGSDETPVTTGYTVQGAGDENGGKVVFSAVPDPAYGILTILRRVPAERLIDYQSAGELSADTFNTDLDLIWQAVGDLWSAVKRVVRLKDTSQAAELKLPDYLSGSPLGWGDSASELVNLPIDLPAVEGRLDGLDAATDANSSRLVSVEAKADAALAQSAGGYGSVVKTGKIALVDAQQTYTILQAGDDPAPAAENLTLTIVGGGDLYPDDDYTLDVGGKSITLVPPVSSTDAAGTLNAGDEIFWRLVAGGLVTAVLGDGQVTEQKLGASAVALSKIKNSPANTYGLLGFDADGHPVIYPAPGAGLALGGETFSPLALPSVPPVPAFAQSDWQPLVYERMFTFDHGLAAAPFLAGYLLRCVIADSPFAAGEVFYFFGSDTNTRTFQASTLDVRAMSTLVSATATQVIVETPYRGIEVGRRSSVPKILTASRWEISLIAMKGV